MKGEELADADALEDEVTVLAELLDWVDKGLVVECEVKLSDEDFEERLEEDVVDDELLFEVEVWLEECDELVDVGRIETLLEVLDFDDTLEEVVVESELLLRLEVEDDMVDDELVFELEVEGDVFDDELLFKVDVNVWLEECAVVLVEDEVKLLPVVPGFDEVLEIVEFFEAEEEETVLE